MGLRNGDGQAAIGLAPYFRTVHATDISAEQVGQGFARSNIIYSAQPAEETNFPDHLVDLVAVGQALHWFDLDAFWGEAGRVAKPGALFCAFGYAWFEVPAEVRTTLIEPLTRLVSPFCAPNNRILWNGYRQEDIGLPFERVKAPDFQMQAEWTLPQLIGYVTTWSAYRRAKADEQVAMKLDELLASARHQLPHDQTFVCSTPLKLVAGRVR